MESPFVGDRVGNLSDEVGSVRDHEVAVVRTPGDGMFQLGGQLAVSRVEAVIAVWGCADEGNAVRDRWRGLPSQIRGDRIDCIHGHDPVCGVFATRHTDEAIATVDNGMLPAELRGLFRLTLEQRAKTGIDADYVIV
jgi:hypothetical protein